MPVTADFHNIEDAYQDLERSITDAQTFSKNWNWDWEKWFAEALEQLKIPTPVQTYYANLLPTTYENIMGRQLFAGAFKAWVFGGLGSWNDMLITDPSQDKEYQQISKRLYEAIIQSLGAVTNSTTDYSLEISKY